LSGQRSKLRARRSRCKFARRSVRHRRGRGMRLRRIDLGEVRAAACCFLVVRLMRASEEMWRVMWVFCQAHLLKGQMKRKKCTSGREESVNMCEDEEKEQDEDKLRNCTYSNCKAAILLGKPVTSRLISHGLNESRDVLTAPPLDSPLCCFRRRTGLGVLPTYSCAWRIVERSR
jgi:hypothetical protein